MHPDTPRYTDEYIDHWGDVFQRKAIAATLGITFERFLQSPQQWVDALDRTVDGDRIELGSADYEPLLPEQLRVQRAVDQANAYSASELDRMTDAMSHSRTGEPARMNGCGNRLIEPCRSHTFSARPTAERHNR